MPVLTNLIFAPVLVFPRLQRFSITLKRRQRAKINPLFFSWNQKAQCLNKMNKKHLSTEKELKFIIFTSILTSDMMTKRVGNGIPTH
ncbi:hypothetical protein CS953_12370 [Bacillus safensis]|nr:hypothetical protein CS953_12370 [Bacillus safensis]TFV08405.1 hypothetical protein E4T85_14680 [Bacillus stratosphericus]